MSARNDETAETLFGYLKTELGFDLRRGFLAAIADELAKTGELSAATTEALTLREIGIIEACSEFALGGQRSQAA